MGEKTQQNFLNIDSQYNAKTINQNTREYPTLSNLFLLLPTTTTKLAHWMNE